MNLTGLYALIIYLAAVNGYAFLLMGHDKQRARKQRRRVPEKRLFMLSAIGGAAGTWLGMRAWRHKTQHRSFTVGIPFLLGMNLLVLIGILWLVGINVKS
ncbi:DUF1294 domain-containing protein [Paenibacillus harenae]|uniref:DUF1294 domain-containing protein n=1 Tax=Paenibacillus harenae TaxID=306543 RepID=UPI0003F97F29|nr:DUF1294 domain-containing protein [Paenibacillus harenae]